MQKYLYEVTLERGSNHPEYRKFLKNATEHNAIAPDYAGIRNVCLVSHHMDAKTVKLLMIDGFKKGASDLSVEEITNTTLKSTNSHHRIYTDTIKNRFLPYGDYPNLT